MFDGLISTKTGMPISPAVFPPACSTFSQMSFDDMWDEAHMSQVCHYVRAGKDSKIPEEFRDYIPRKL